MNNASRVLCLCVHTPNYKGLDELDRKNILLTLKPKFEMSTACFSKLVFLELKNGTDMIMTPVETSFNENTTIMGDTLIEYYEFQHDARWNERPAVKTNTLDHFIAKKIIAKKIAKENVVLIVEDVFISKNTVTFGTLEESDVCDAVSQIKKNHHYRVYNRIPATYDHTDDFLSAMQNRASVWKKTALVVSLFFYALLSTHHSLIFWFYNYFSEFNLFGLSFVGHRDLGHHDLKGNVSFSDTVRVSKYGSKNDVLKSVYRSTLDDYSPRLKNSTVYNGMTTKRGKSTPKIATITDSFSHYVRDNTTTPVGFVYELFVVAFFYMLFLYEFGVIQSIIYMAYDISKYYLLPLFTSEWRLAYCFENSKHYENLLSPKTLVILLVLYATLLKFSKTIDAKAIGHAFSADAKKSDVQAFTLNRHSMLMLLYCYFGRFVFIIKFFFSIYYVIARFYKFIKTLFKPN